MESKVTFDSTKLIFKEGKPAEKLFLIKKGEVLCLKSSKDRLIPVFLAKENDIIGESAMMHDMPHAYSAVSMSPVELIEIPAKNFEEIMGIAPAWLIDLTTTMIARFQTTAGLIAENRVLGPRIMDEDQFTSALEVELKKLINQ